MYTIVQCTLHNIHCTMNSACYKLFTVYGVKCIFLYMVHYYISKSCIVQRTACIVQCTTCIIQCTPFIVQCIDNGWDAIINNGTIARNRWILWFQALQGHCSLYTIHRTMYTIHSTVCTIHHTMYTIRCTARYAYSAMSHYYCQISHWYITAACIW